MLFGSLYYKWKPKSTLLFEIAMRLHQVQMKGCLILHVKHIAVTITIGGGFDGLSRGNNLGGMVRGVKPLKLVPVDEGAVEISPGLEG